METRQSTILIIEDEPDVREALKTVLEQQQFAVLLAEDGEVGLTMALQEKPDLVLLDITMPKMNGIEVLKSLRADDWGKGVKVIVMTVLDDLSKVAEVLEAGGDEYLIKSESTLESIVEKIKEKLKL